MFIPKYELGFESPRSWNIKLFPNVSNDVRAPVIMLKVATQIPDRESGHTRLVSKTNEGAVLDDLTVYRRVSYLLVC